MQQSELKDWCKNPPEGCSLESETPDPIFTWVILMQGPEPCKGMPRLYEGEVYRLQVKFTDSYPLDSPEVIQPKEWMEMVVFTYICGKLRKYRPSVVIHQFQLL